LAADAYRRSHAARPGCAARFFPRPQKSLAALTDPEGDRGILPRLWGEAVMPSRSFLTRLALFAGLTVMLSAVAYWGVQSSVDRAVAIDAENEAKGWS